ncbi:ankyrin [Aspergillus californicus]
MSASFDNQNSGTLNANTGEGPQNNNNSTGAQYNIGTYISSKHVNYESLSEQVNDNEIIQSLAFPEMLARRSSIEQRHGSSCEWILELREYKSWRSQSCGLLWIKGKPGAGKSTLMHFLHDKLQEPHDGDQGIALEFFFTARGTELQHTPSGMFRSLVRQLFDHDQSVRPKVREIYERKCRQFGYGKREWEWQKPELEGLLTESILLSAQQQRVTIFADALDEAGREPAQELAEYFHEINARAIQAKAAVKICISCRHYPFPASVPGIEICVEEHNRADIATYINDKLRLEWIDANDPLDKVTWTTLKDDLIKQAKGVFQWARIITPLIKHMAQDGNSPQHVRDWLHQVPPVLEGVYEYIFRHVISSKDRVQSFLLFQWVCLAERPLSVTEMRYALAARDARIKPYRKRFHETVNFIQKDKHMKQRVKGLSGGLAEVVTTSSGAEGVQVTHQSVNDFLRVKGLGVLAQLAGATECTIMDHNNTLRKSQAMLYRSCLVYLATEDIPLAGLNDSYTLAEQNRKLLLDKSPFLDYATINIFVHAEKAQGERAGVIEQEIRVLQQCISKWVQIFRALDRWGLRTPAKGTTLLHMAATANLTDLVEHLASATGATQERDQDGKTAFHAAARCGHIGVGELLVANGADYEVRGDGARTPLLEAASHGQAGFVEWLLTQGVRINDPKGGSESALQAASLGGKIEVVQMLLDAGADVHAQSGEYGNALQAGSYHGSIEIVRILLDAGASVHAQGGEYSNALQAASYHGSIECPCSGW